MCSSEVGLQGAERQIATIEEIQRFDNLPMTVTFLGGEDGQQPESRIFSVDAANDDGSTTWRMAEVKGNAPGLGRLMNKKTKERRWHLTMDQIINVQLYIEP